VKAVVRVFLGVVWDLSVVWVSVKPPAAKVITVLPVVTALGVKRAAAESGCVGRSCTHDYDCDVDEKCCLDVCTNAQKCNCDHDSECPSGEICCRGSCSDKGDCSANSYKNPTLVIVGSVLGSLVLISLISIVIYLIYRRRRNIALTGSAQTVPVSVTSPNNTALNVPTSHAAEKQASCGKLNVPPNDYGAIPSRQIYSTH